MSHSKFFVTTLLQNEYDNSGTCFYNMAMENKTHLLLIDDDREICDLLNTFLTKHGYKVTVKYDGEQIISLINKENFALLLLDIMLPGDDGFTLCRQIRRQSNIPIIMLTAMNTEIDRVAGLETGADDYLAKPFSLRELLARIKSVLRRCQPHENSSELMAKILPLPYIKFAGWTLDQNKRRCIAPDGLVVPLSASEYELLIAFVEHPMRILNRDQLLDLTRGKSADPFDRSIDVQVGRLRRKLEEDPKNPELIITIRGGGYQFNTAILQENKHETISQ